MGKPLLISLFCGPGGMDQGFSEAGFETRLAVDIDLAAIRTHRHNHPRANAFQLDLSNPDNALVELLARWPEDEPPKGVIGGPPCQSFSFGNVYQHEADPRHRLPLAYAAILKGLNKHYNLDFFVFENVPGLKYLHREKFRQFEQAFAEAGFRTFIGELDAKDFGVPQLRPRVFIVGLNAKKYRDVDFEFPVPDPNLFPPKTVRDVLWELKDKPVVFSSDVPKVNLRNASLEDLTRAELERNRFILERTGVHPNHWCMVPRSPKFGNLQPGRRGKSFKVLDWDKPSWTIAFGHREVHVHPSGSRRLSMFEAMLLQGFPPTYELLGTLTDQIRLVSEVVSPPVATVLGLAIAKALGYPVNGPTVQTARGRFHEQLALTI